MDPLISILVPVYNAEKFLVECIESILRQTYRNIQLILINDGSIDNSLSICNYYKYIDSRVLVIDKPNSGVSATRNLGLSVAEGDFIGFVDSDDFIEENMYEELLKRMIEDDSDLCAMTAYTINYLDKQGIKSRKTLEGREALKYLLLLEFPTSLWACLYSRNIIKDLALNIDIHFFEDFEFNFKVLLNSNRVSMCDERLYNYRKNETSANSQGINGKRMTCLNIYDLIITKIERGDDEYLKYASYFRAHCIITCILSISKSHEVKEKYYKIVYLNAKLRIKETIFSQYVPFRHKATILAFLIFPRIFPKILYYINSHCCPKQDRIEK